MKFTETAGGGLEVLTPAKINIYLEIGPLRDDGYHDIDGLFQAVSLYDRISLLPTQDGEIHLEEKGVSAGEDNLVYRAAELLRREALPEASRAGVHMVLEKTIPQGAGLGGGSSDAAAILVALARLWNLEATRQELSTLGARIGSDIPFFLYGGTARCRGRGEIVSPYHDAFDRAAPLHYVLVSPHVPAATRAVYAALDESRAGEIALTRTSPLDSMTSVGTLGRVAGGEVFFNRLEGVSCRLFPELEGVLSWMREESFLTVKMTGSGSTFYGLCRDAEDAERVYSRLVARGRNTLPTLVDVRAVQSLPSFSFPWITDS